jgi:hypothetical protein
MFGPDVEGPDYQSMFGPDESIPFRPELALKNAPKSAFETAKRVAADILPGQHVQTGFALAQPGGLSNAWEGLKERYGGVENIKRTAEKDPVGLGYDVGGLFTGGKTAAGHIPKPTPKSLIPARGQNLVSGGLQMKIAKLDPAKVPADLLEAPMQRFRDRLKADAIELDPQFMKPEIMNRVKRLDEAYKPTPRSPEFGMTGVEPPAKPPVTLAELHGHRKSLDNFINRGAGKTDGQINEHGKIAIELKKTVNEIIEKHPMSPAFKSGSNQVRLGKMEESFDQIKKDASLTAQWRNGNEVAALQNATANFLKAKKNRYAFTPEVRRKLEAFSRDKQGRLLSAFGSKTVSGQAAGRLVESAFGVPGILWGPGIMAREARAARMMSEWERIAEQIREGSL